MTRLALLHTTAPVVPVFTALTSRYLSGVDCVNLVDETLLRDTIAEGKLTQARVRRVLEWLVAAEATGSNAVLVTCSSIGPAVDAVRTLIDVPVIRVDEPMVERALQLGTRIGVLATLSTTLEPTRELVARKAAAAGREVHIAARVCEGAFEALMAGDAPSHDRLVLQGLMELREAADVVVLAQASMARAAAAAPDTGSCAVLSSPELGVRHMAELLLHGDAVGLAEAGRS